MKSKYETIKILLINEKGRIKGLNYIEEELKKLDCKSILIKRTFLKEISKNQIKKEIEIKRLK